MFLPLLSPASFILNLEITQGWSAWVQFYLTDHIPGAGEETALPQFSQIASVLKPEC